MATAKLTFHGGAGTVTGSNFLFEVNGKRILVDCGMFQGEKVGEDKNRKAFPYEPASIDVLFITHAHLDHIGRIPKLVKDGFKGRIISTAPTKDVAELMLIDGAKIIGREAEESGLVPIYTKKDVATSLSLWESAPYNKEISLGGDLRVVLGLVGHVLGSASIQIMRGKRKIVFTGDLGNPPAPLLPTGEYITDADYMVIESVYGDRVHEGRRGRKKRLKEITLRTIERGGVLLIPAFSFERTQKLLFEITTMMEAGEIPSTPIFIDSPLAIKIINVYRKYTDYFNEDIKELLGSGKELFSFPQVKMTLKTDESKAIARVENPKIILAGSGMSNGGRILHHERRYLPDPNSTLLLAGFQAPGTLGRLLQEGVSVVTIMGRKVSVKAEIETISAYSAHADSERLLEFVSHATKLKKVFTVMGEPHSTMALAQRIRDYIGVLASVPKEGESVELEF